MHMTEQTRTDLKKGIVLVLFAWLFFATSYLITKIIGPRTTVPTLLFFRFNVGILLLLPWMLEKKSYAVYSPSLIFIRALAGLLNTAFVYMAVQTISLVDTTLLTNSAPLFVPFIVWLWLKKPIQHSLWPALILGFVGIILILHPDREIFHLGAFLALGSGIATAVSLVAMRHASHKERLPTVLFYTFVFGWVVTLPFLWGHFKVGSPLTLLALIGVGILATLGQWSLFKALRFGKASYIAPFGYASVLYSAAFDWLIFAQIPDLWAWMGVILVTLAGILIIYKSNASPSLKS